MIALWVEEQDFLVAVNDKRTLQGSPNAVFKLYGSLGVFKMQFTPALSSRRSVHYG